jgi:signal peptidase I
MQFRRFENAGRDLRDTVLHILRDYSESLILAIIFALILRQFVFSAYRISNVMMEPTLKLGDFVLGYKLPYGVTIPFLDKHIGQTSPRRGDVLVFRCPSRPEASCIKRAVAVSGDRVEIRGQRLIINGVVAKYSRSEKPPEEILAAQAAVVTLHEGFSREGHDILISDVEHKVDFGPYIVPPDSFFALGDNRDFSEDSRHWGAVPNRSIEARAFNIWVSIDWIADGNGMYHSKVRKERILQPIH